MVSLTINSRTVNPYHFYLYLCRFNMVATAIVLVAKIAVYMQYMGIWTMEELIVLKEE